MDGYDVYVGPKQNPTASDATHYTDTNGCTNFKQVLKTGIAADASYLFVNTNLKKFGPNFPVGGNLDGLGIVAPGSPRGSTTLRSFLNAYLDVTGQGVLRLEGNCVDIDNPIGVNFTYSPPNYVNKFYSYQDPNIPVFYNNMRLVNYIANLDLKGTLVSTFPYMAGYNFEEIQLAYWDLVHPTIDVYARAQPRAIFPL